MDIQINIRIHSKTFLFFQNLYTKESRLGRSLGQVQWNIFEISLGQVNVPKYLLDLFLQRLVFLGTILAIFIT